MIARWEYFQVLMRHEDKVRKKLRSEVMPVWSEACRKAYRSSGSLSHLSEEKALRFYRGHLIVCLDRWLSNSFATMRPLFRDAFVETLVALFRWRNELSWLPPLERPERDDLLVLPALYALWVWLEYGEDAPLEGCYIPAMYQGGVRLPDDLDRMLQETCDYYFPGCEDREAARFRAGVLDGLRGEPSLYDLEHLLGKVETYYKRAGWEPTIQLRTRKVSPAERFEWVYYRHVKTWTYQRIADHWSELHAERGDERDSVVSESDVCQRVQGLFDLLGILT